VGVAVTVKGCSEIRYEYVALDELLPYSDFNISRQAFSHSRHCLAHFAMCLSSGNFLQAAAHFAQASAQALQISLAKGPLRETI